VTIVPAIDLRAGKCVRLLQGDPLQETRYDGDPVERARAFVAAGAKRLHVVDLDGAFRTGENLAALRAICAAVDVPVETGGGIRTRDDIEVHLNAGAAFVIIGTLLVEAPELTRVLLGEYGNRLIAAVDARDRDVAVFGWQTASRLDRDELIADITEWGFERIVFTAIARDGAGTGYDVEALAHVAALTSLRITASGGARTIDDLRELVATSPPNVDSAIVGRAAYEGTLDLALAIAEFG
jgi:phosphoribosylformimino-5-aminoimidazole carboxamide ribotide isomerase